MLQVLLGVRSPFASVNGSILIILLLAMYPGNQTKEGALQLARAALAA